jgi:hypothetical protein
MTVWPNFDVVARVRGVYGVALEIVTSRPDSETSSTAANGRLLRLIAR